VQLLTEAKNEATTLFYNLEASIKESASVLSKELKLEIKEKAVALKSALADPKISISDLRQKISAMQETMFALRMAVYSQQNPQTETESTPPPDGTSPKGSPQPATKSPKSAG
jgi:molecular chaperone DnaK